MQERRLDPNRVKNGNPIVKWRITNPAYIVDFVKNLPKIKMSEDSFRTSVRHLYGDSFFTTAYQLYCQLGLYYISEDGMYYPRFDHDITENEARQYFSSWIKRYYVPNPYTKQGFRNLTKPIVIVPSFIEYLKKQSTNKIDFNKMCSDVFKEDLGAASNPLKSTLINAEAPFLFEGNMISLKPNYEDFMEVNAQREDKKAFFEFIGNDKTKPIPTSHTQQDTNHFTPTQIIYYGVPGCGKSYEVNKVINDELGKYGVTDKEYHKVRCVFHPEYCSADFVGQIYPYVKPDNGGVEYRFKPGPFAEIVRRAYRNPKKPFFLIIEEINRGNAAAIFGETFQLLDRIRPEDGPEELSGNIYNTGWSSYGVTNIDVNAYVRQKSTDNPEKIEYDDSIPYGDKIKFINNTAVRLPPNLSIYATMNTSDQNVSAMDNAFQRRFKSKMIRNDLTCESQYNLKIGDTGVCWGSFRDWINGKILLLGMGSSKAEDKCLGGWFIKGEKKINEDGSVSNEYADFQKDEFAEKVLKYLWNDVFNRNKSFEIFNSNEVKSLSSLIDVFEKSEGIDSFKKVFILTDEEIDKLKQEKSKNL